MEVRIVAASAIIAVCALSGVIALAIYLPRRRREKLRRRGIKIYEIARVANRRPLG